VQDVNDCGDGLQGRIVQLVSAFFANVLLSASAGSRYTESEGILMGVATLMLLLRTRHAEGHVLARHTSSGKCSASSL
jgi:hypothetical protein